MLSYEERQYLVWLAAQTFEGWGAIVDLGPWLGGSSAMLAHGLKSAGKEHTIRSFDIFQWEPHYMSAVADEDLKPGDDFLPLFLREIGEYAPWIAAEKQDLMTYRWDGGPIEILFVDAAKTWELTNAIFRGFGAHLVPGRSRVVLQDFRHHTTHWLPLIIDSRPDLWEQVESVDCGTTVTFIPRLPLIGPAGMPLDYAEGSFSLEVAERLLRLRMAEESPAHQALMLQTLYRRSLMDGPIDRLRALRAEVIAAGVEADELASIEGIWPVLVPQGWTAYLAGDHGTARTLAERCLMSTDRRPVQAVALLGMSLMRLGDLAMARECIDEVLTYLPDFRAARLHHAELALEEGRLEEAEANALEAVRYGDGEDAVIEHAIGVLEQACRGDAARRRVVPALVELAGVFGQSPTLLTHLAREQYKLGRRDEAIANVDRALEAAPGHLAASRLRTAWLQLPHG